MASNALIQTRIDPDVKDRATAVLHNLGLTVSNAVRILLTRIANEGALPLGFATAPVSYNAWFSAKVQEAPDPVPTPSASCRKEVRCEAGASNKARALQLLQI